MPTVSIMIPTNKPDVNALINDLLKTEYEKLLISASCLQQSAAKNRNWCIDNCHSDIIVMVDDDVEVMEGDWLTKLLAPLIKYRDQISVIAPRLHSPQKQPCAQLGNNGWHDIIETGLKCACHTPETKLNITTSACIAFFKEDGVRFNEKYPDACFEDSDFCMRYKKKFPNKKIVINEHSKLIHHNRGSWRSGKTWEYNRQLFFEEWGIRI
uniref:Putative glycosyltransferase n=1 Tax=viral metagenome TaxID=1070528 RepID=A0A6M3MA18_9ZZZZ